ncbi:hypothetical protein PG989_004855 [Apiospora arundinis]
MVIVIVAHQSPVYRRRREGSGSIGVKSVKLCHQHAGEEGGIPSPHGTDSEVDSHGGCGYHAAARRWGNMGGAACCWIIGRRRGGGREARVSPKEQPYENRIRPPYLYGDGPRVDVVIGEEHPVAEKVAKLRQVTRPIPQLHGQVGLLLRPGRCETEHMPRRREEEGAPDDGQEEAQGSPDHGGMQGIDEGCRSILIMTVVMEDLSLLGYCRQRR